MERAARNLISLALLAALASASGHADVRLANISTRGEVGTGHDVLIGGFVVQGSVPLTIVLRAIGPSIDERFTLSPERLADPHLELFSSAGDAIASNDNWMDDASSGDIPVELQPTHAAESALLVTLPPGAYTAIVSGVGGATGIGLVEVFEVGGSDLSRLINLSSRVRVGSGDSVAIGGLIVSGDDAPRTYLVRARSTSVGAGALAPETLLPNPRLELFRGEALIGVNDDWRSDAAAGQIPATHVPGFDEEAALLVTLEAGAYTGVVSGVDGGEGIAIVEVFEVTEDLVDLDVSPALPLHTLNVPERFGLSVFARVTNARQMARAANGTIYVGSFAAGRVVAIQDRDFDGRADAHHTIDTGLDNPTGVAWRDGDLFVAAVSRILRYRDIDNRLTDPPPPEVVTDALPTDAHHGWKVLGFGPDGLLYTNVGAPCNVCLRDEIYATIVRLDVDQPGTPEVQIVASGVRNSVGFDWHPTTGELWFTDNGRDWLGDHAPPDELNRLASPGEHFGFPFVHGDGALDPSFGAGIDPADYTPPALALGPHVAALGMAFYSGYALPVAYRNQAFIAEHGSWNRTASAGHIGYRLSFARELGSGQLGYETFIDGWLGADDEAWGRPSDIITMPDGSLLVADDRADAIYRITYHR